MRGSLWIFVKIVRGKKGKSGREKMEKKSIIDLIKKRSKEGNWIVVDKDVVREKYKGFEKDLNY